MFLQSACVSLHPTKVYWLRLRQLTHPNP